jgi:alkanesulfonate monooxygenase SsuD/methylene tetrahydromethanopterin reductase-like flavin-dependent oxidoreductase (luciferase family)
VALEGAGWHPAAWRVSSADPKTMFTADYWVRLARRADEAGLDFLTIEDGMALQSSTRGVADDRVDQVRGRLDAVMVAARMAPATSSIGVVPTVTTTHTEPFHAAKAVATLDYVSRGRAGMRAQISPLALEASLFGRRTIDGSEPLLHEAADYVEVVRRLWDSWEDGAEIRDVRTGRFIDRNRLHPVDFAGPFFSVRGPSITPRPPQGQPLVIVLAHAQSVYELAARSADVVLVTPARTGSIESVVADVRRAEDAVGRPGTPLRTFAEVVTFLSPTAPGAQQRKDILDELDGHDYRSDAAVFVGTPDELADLLVEWHAAGVDGFRLRPAVLPDDLVQITGPLVEALRRRGRFRSAPPAGSLRSRLGLSRPPNRYEPAQQGAAIGDSPLTAAGARQP